MMKSPCKNCLMIPLCKHKDVIGMMIGCTTVVDFLFEDREFKNTRPDYMERVQQVEGDLGLLTMKGRYQNE